MEPPKYALKVQISSESINQFRESVTNIPGGGQIWRPSMHFEPIPSRSSKKTVSQCAPPSNRLPGKNFQEENFLTTPLPPKKNASRTIVAKG